jgi:hypothetical protein
VVLIASTSIAMLDSNLNADCVCIFGGVHPVRIPWQGSRQPVVHLLMIEKELFQLRPFFVMVLNPHA